MKLVKYLKKNKAGVARVFRLMISVFLAAYILIVVGILNRVFMYIFARWNLDIIQNSLNSSLPGEYIVMLLIWNYIIGFAVIGLVWKYFGIPRVTFIGKCYKRFMDIYYVGD